MAEPQEPAAGGEGGGKAIPAGQSHFGSALSSAPKAAATRVPRISGVATATTRATRSAAVAAMPRVPRRLCICWRVLPIYSLLSTETENGMNGWTDTRGCLRSWDEGSDRRGPSADRGGGRQGAARGRQCRRRVRGSGVHVVGVREPAERPGRRRLLPGALGPGGEDAAVRLLRRGPGRRVGGRGRGDGRSRR